jgi:hypothetical protein
MPKLKTLRVHPNPYLHLDHEGRPAGACPFDPDEHDGSSLRYVGATRVTTETRREDPRRGITAQHDYTWEFSKEAVVVPATDYYRRAIRSGELLAADVETFVEAGGAREHFIEHPHALRHSKHGACARHKANHGEHPEAALAHWADAPATADAVAPPAALGGGVGHHQNG